MNSRVVTWLSISGVVVAGLAALAVNTAVLDRSGAAADQVRVVIPSTLGLGTASSPSSAPTAEPTPIPSETSVPLAATTSAQYQVGDAGVVTLDTAGDVLTIVSVTPNPGWVVERAERKDSGRIEVRFESGEADVRFEANLLFGVVTTSVDSD